MPFTPLHLGPGLLAKGILGQRFSVMIFGGTQVLMDIEPLWGMVNGWDRLHGPTHTLLGATAIAMVATMIGPPISHAVLNWFDPQKRLGVHHITKRVALLSALLGAWSHVALDAIMHWDVQPLAPFSVSNPLQQVISTPALHWWCVGTGVVGITLMIWRYKRT